MSTEFMQAPVSTSLFNYWNDLRRDRMAPRRFEIEPSCIAGFLPDTFILERVNDKSLRFRLAGTRISDALGVELRGVNLFDMFDAEDRQVLQGDISQVVSHGAVAVIHIEASNDIGFSAKFEMLVLPLMHTRDVVDRFLGAMAPAERPEWLGTVALTKRKIVSREIIWPDGKPRSPAEKQLPFLPSLREARIVRAERRQFRVYEGGLSAPKR